MNRHPAGLITLFFIALHFYHFLQKFPPYIRKNKNNKSAVFIKFELEEGIT